MLTSSQHDLSIPDLFRGDLQLTSPPNIYFELQKTSLDPTKSLTDVAFIIEKDPSLAIRVLKIVNSAFYGFPSKITSIDRAINLIGVKELQSIILSTIVIDKFSNLPDDLISMHDFWARSLTCALIAQKCDQLLGGEFSDSVFLCGILHNIGQLIFFRRIPELARETSLSLQAYENPSDIDEINIEQHIIGFDHYQTGAALSKLWNLPAIFTESIRLHAYPDNTDSYHKISSIIRLADCCSKIETHSYNINPNTISISSSNLETMIQEAHEEFEEIFKIFYPG